MGPDKAYQNFLKDLTEEEKKQAEEMYDIILDNEYDALDNDAQWIVPALWKAGFRKVK